MSSRDYVLTLGVQLTIFPQGSGIVISEFMFHALTSAAASEALNGL